MVRLRAAPCVTTAPRATFRRARVRKHVIHVRLGSFRAWRGRLGVWNVLPEDINTSLVWRVAFAAIGVNLPTPQGAKTVRFVCQGTSVAKTTALLRMVRIRQCHPQIPLVLVHHTAHRVRLDSLQAGVGHTRVQSAP